MAKAVSPTTENLIQIGTEPLTRWLIDCAKNRTFLPYGEAKERFETELGFSTIFPTLMGHPAGAAINRIHKARSGAPLLNVLLVRQDDSMPGSGAGSYLAARFRTPRLRHKQARERYPAKWRACFERAVEQVYAFSDWDEVYRNVYGRQIPRPTKARNQSGKEKDGIQYGRTGEGKNHRNLRRWVLDNPGVVMPRFNVIEARTEVELLSGDRVDDVYYGKSRTVAIEVKSRDSNEADIERGLYQCVKYRSVLRAMDPRKDPPVDALLVTEDQLMSHHERLRMRLGIKHYRAKKIRAN